MQKMQMLYEGKAKKVYATDDENLCIVSYKDDATAFNGKRKAQLSVKALSTTVCPIFFFKCWKRKGLKPILCKS